MREADVTIAHGSATGLACAIAGLGRGRPFVYRQISDTRFWAGSRWRRARVSRYLRFARSIVALSAGAKADLVDHLGLPASMIDVVPNGVPVGNFAPADPATKQTARRELGLPHDSVVVLYIGALVPEKGADVAVEAMADTHGVHLLVVGGGPDEGELRRRSAEVAATQIHFAGVLADASVAYRAADIVVLPSKGGDSMPATLIEAGFCGLPCISTDIGSITDIVIDGSTGRIVPADDVGALRAAIHDLAADRALVDRLGVAARSYCLQNFEIGVVADRWLAVLDATL